MSPKVETGLAGGCDVPWTSIKHDAGRPPMSTSTHHPKLGKAGTRILTAPGTAEVSTRGSSPALRVRSALKPSTPTQEPMTPTRAKQSPRMISLNAQSSSVVAPLRDGNAACMLFSQADLRLPRTAPLSARSYRSNDGFDGGRYIPCGEANRAHSARAAISSGYSNAAWLASPSSRALAGASSSSPPRLAALSPTALAPPISPSGKLRTTKSKLNDRSSGEDVVSSSDGVTAATLGQKIKRFSAGTVSPASESEPPQEFRGFDKGHSAVTRRYTLDIVPPLEKPIVGEADYLADDGLSWGQRSQEPRGLVKDLVENKLGKVDQAGTQSAEVESIDRTRSVKSPKIGTHAGMSVAEFADKVAALAAEVAKVFGRKRVSQSVDCTNYGLE